ARRIDMRPAGGRGCGLTSRPKRTSRAKLFGMRRGVGLASIVLLLAALTFGLAGAAARSSAATTTVIVTIEGRGTVTDGNVLSCGNGSVACYFDQYQNSSSDLVV